MSYCSQLLYMSHCPQLLFMSYCSHLLVVSYCSQLLLMLYCSQLLFNVLMFYCGKCLPWYISTDHSFQNKTHSYQHIVLNYGFNVRYNMFRTVQMYMIISIFFFFLQGKAAARAHAVSKVKGIRTWSNRIFTTGLSQERNVNERKKIIDELYSRLVDLIAQSPGDGGYDYVYLIVTVAKTGER